LVTNSNQDTDWEGRTLRGIKDINLLPNASYSQGYKIVRDYAHEAARENDKGCRKKAKAWAGVTLHSYRG